MVLLLTYLGIGVLVLVGCICTDKEAADWEAPVLFFTMVLWPFVLVAALVGLLVE